MAYLTYRTTKAIRHSPLSEENTKHLFYQLYHEAIRNANVHNKFPPPEEVMEEAAHDGRRGRKRRFPAGKLR